MTPVKSMPTNTIDRNCDNKEHETTEPSCQANSFALITEREDSMNVNDLPAKLESHRLSDSLSDYANFDVRDAFWPPPIFTWKTIPGSNKRECVVSYDYSVPYDPEVKSWVFSPNEK